MKKSLMIGIGLIIFCIVLVVRNEIVKNNIHYTNLHDITNSESKVEGAYVYIDITFVAGSITNENNNGYYVMFSDGVQFIVYISNEKASEINRYLLDNPDNSYKIVGITKLIPTTMEENGKKFVKEWLDNNHNHEGLEEEHDHNITTDEFYHYFGYVYMDTNVKMDVVTKIIIYLTGITGALIVLYAINTKYRFI